MTTTEDEIDATFSNAGYWAAQRVGAVAQPSVITTFESINPNDWNNPSGSAIYIKYEGSNRGPLSGATFYAEGRNMIVRVIGTSLENMRNVYQTCIRLLKKYHSTVEIGNVTRPYNDRHNSFVADIHLQIRETINYL